MVLRCLVIIRFESGDVSSVAEHGCVTLVVLIDMTLHFIHEVHRLLICRAGSAAAYFSSAKHVFFVFLFTGDQVYAGDSCHLPWHVVNGEVVAILPLYL